MQKMTWLSFLLCSFVSVPAFAEETIRQDPLQVVYAADNDICSRIFKMYSGFSGCRLSEGGCFRFKWNLYEDKIFSVINRSGVWNQYGYTSVDIAWLTSRDTNYSIVYLSNFLGDRSPRLSEVWKVNRERLDEVWKLPRNETDKNANSEAFQKLLDGGEKLSDGGLVFEIDGNPYLFVLECDGLWEYGASYQCNRVVGLTVIDVHSDKQSAPVCKLRSPTEQDASDG